MHTDRPAGRQPERSALARIGVWQGLLVLVACLALVVLRRGSPASLLLGAAFLYGSLALQGLALSFALRAGSRRPGVAVGLFLVKLFALLGFVAIGFGSSFVAPMSFAAGAASLPLAIALDACYGQLAIRSRAPR